jgi:HEPN domain-containing protein
MLRGRTDENNPADWFYFAMDRLRIADMAWRQEGLTAAGIELLQEATERLLKGYLVAKGWRLVRTHDLHDLVAAAAEYDQSFNRFERLAEDLTEDFFAQHYPGEDLADLGNQYELNRQELTELLELVRTSLPQFEADLNFGKQ